MSEYEIGLYRIIGEMIRKIRLSKGMSLEEVANKLDMTRKTLQRYETGERKIKISTIIKLSNILGFDYDLFMSEAKQRLAGNDPVMDDECYYTTMEKSKIAQEMFEDEDMKLLFDLKKTTKANDLMNYARFLKEQYDKENGL